MADRKLIIHIGSHKTGTSSVQAALYQERDVLESQGYSLFASNPDGSPRPNGNANTWLEFEEGAQVECAIRAGLASALKNLAGNVIISAEHFSWVFSEKNIQRFRDQLKHDFDEIAVVAYVRRQDKQAVSHYQQGSEFRAFAATRFYDGDFRALPEYKEHFQKYLNYFDKLSMWANVFGDENTAVRVFDEKYLLGGDAVTDFLSVTGLSIETPRDRKNESRGFEQTKLGHLMNRGKISRRLRRLLMNYVGSSTKSLPSRQDAEDFYRHFRESNRQLNERFGINDSQYLFDENFDKYPLESQDTWSEESANQAILSLLEGVNHLPVLNQRDIKLLRKSARSVAGLDKERSDALQELADRLNMRGQKNNGRAAIRGMKRPKGLKRLKGFLSRIRALVR